MNHATAESTVCYNCGEPLHGRFCAACGQEAKSLNPTLHDFLHEFAHEVLHVDGKIFQSVRKVLFAPGFLTREYFQGRRARWVSPIRLYLIFSVLYFGVASVGGGVGRVKITATGKTNTETQQALQKYGFNSE